MGLFNLFGKKNKDCSIDEFIEQLEKDTERLRNENKAWEKESFSLVENRSKASNLEKSGELFNAISLYELCVEKGIASSRLTIYNYAHDIDRLAILYRKTKQIDAEVVFLERMIELHKDFDVITKWNIRLTKAKSLLTNFSIILPEEPIELPKEKQNTIGKQYFEALQSLPEFDFYKDKPDDMLTSDYLWLNQHLIGGDSKGKKAFFRLKNKFKNMLSDADLLEKQGNLRKAASMYENIINEECFITTPYERLIIIYSKAKLYKEVIRVLENGINFFTKLRDKQSEYVLKLALKNEKLHYCEEKIRNEEKVFYYAGIAELYNPYTIIQKWECRLEKVQKLNEK